MPALAEVASATVEDLAESDDSTVSGSSEDTMPAPEAALATVEDLADSADSTASGSSVPSDPVNFEMG
eukprot:symbB.v1.2.014531.t1/scaffold1031.1/size143042/6